MRVDAQLRGGRLTPKGLRPGSYALTARFFGGLGFAGSASVPATLSVTR